MDVGDSCGSWDLGAGGGSEVGFPRGLGHDLVEAGCGQGPGAPLT